MGTMTKQEIIDKAIEIYEEEYGQMNTLMLAHIWEAIMEGGEDVPDDYAEKFIEPFKEIIRRIVEGEE